MSEAMSSVEIEDVLSSIRRLVSEDLRPAAKAAAMPPPDEKLLLTQAYRVVADRGGPAAAPAPPRLHLGIEPVEPDPAGDETLATLERAVEAQAIEWESEVGDPAPLVARMEWTEDGWAPVEDPTPAVPAPPTASQTPSWAQTEDPVPDADVHAPAQDDSDPATPDDSWADRAEAEAVAALRGTDPADPDPDPGTGSGEEMEYDERILRDIVRDLIREELQGALGERITRNVRKLVRAEIARSIATQDLE